MINSHQKLRDMAKLYKHKDCGSFNILIDKLQKKAKEYNKSYEALAKEFDSIKIDDKTIISRMIEQAKNPAIFYHYLSDQELLKKSLIESPLLEIRSGKLDIIFYFIHDYLSFKKIDDFNTKLSNLSILKKEYEQDLQKIKDLFFDIAYQSQLNHTQTHFITQHPDIDTPEKEKYIDEYNDEAIYHLLYQPDLTFNALLKITKRANLFSFHLVMNLYKSIKALATKDKNFLILHLYIMPQLFCYSKEDIYNISQSTLSFVKENPYSWSKEEKNELLKMCGKLITISQKRENNLISPIMMECLKRVNI